MGILEGKIAVVNGLGAASDQALHVTGHIFRAFGGNIAHDEPWRLGAAIDNPKVDTRWDPAAIAAEVDAQISHLRHPGLGLTIGG